MDGSRQDLIDRLNLSGKRLSKSHRRIADFIVNHYDKAVFMTAATLGEMVGVSESTVVRFAVALGYEGYPQLQHSLQELVRHRLTAVQRFEMSAEIGEEEVLSTVLKADMMNIRHTVDQLDQQAFSQVVGRLLEAKTIFVLGMRSAAPLAQFF
ncbi:MAG: MurR/RpiR family transcriptional regulator, partial [Eubacteriales bacterium]|nr:MurR/RpiR family transcriptional regulator [Eubacteriales bacterium]